MKAAILCNGINWTINKINTIYNTSRIKSSYEGKATEQIYDLKAYRTKIQFHHWHPWLSGKASVLDMQRTWVRLLASVKFFIYSVASILQCSPCEVLEGPISTRVGII